MTENNTDRRATLIRIPIKLQRISWRDLAATLGPVLLISLCAIWIALHYVRPAPPRTIFITTGEPGSTFHTFAQRYRTILSREGVTLEVLTSQGALDNLKRLADPSINVDVGFVQGGLSGIIEDTDHLMSLGSVFYEPLAIFYRGAPIERLSELRNKRIAIGREGSGTRTLALSLLKANGVEARGATRFTDLTGEAAAHALTENRVDAAFLVGESATPANMRMLVHAPGVRIFDFTQADGYVRRFRYLSKIELPPGSLDLGRNVPRRTLTLVAPTIELVARDSLHPALSDLLIEAAREVHGGANLIQRAGEFPAPLEHEYRISDDASRYYKSGKGFLYRYLPFWLASLVDRAFVLLLPIAVLLIPGLRLVPSLYGWRIRTRIFRRYGELMELERATLSPITPAQRGEMHKRLDDFENAVIATKMPGAYADQMYILRRHIQFVRNKLHGNVASAGVPVNAQ